MNTQLPSTSAALKHLLQADLTIQWRNRKSVILVLLVPVILLISWKGVIDKIGAAFAVSTSLTMGLIAIGLMGYSNSIARDRDKGVFQRLRVSPVPSWSIMVSRLMVQLLMILLLTTLVFIAASNYDHITLSPQGYALTYLTAVLGGALYLGIGQMIVGLIKNPETVNSTTRLVYFVFIMVGIFADMGVMGEQVKEIVHWSPYGTVKTMIGASTNPSLWTNKHTIALLASAGYAVVFSLLGIKWFKWNSK